MAVAQELLEALRDVRQSLGGEAQPDEAGLARQVAAMDRLQSLMQAGLPALDEEQARLLVAELESLVVASRFHLKWAQILAGVAKIGAPRVDTAPRASRLDLVS